MGFILRVEICWQSVPCNIIGLLSAQISYCCSVLFGVDELEGMLLFMGRFTMRARLVGFGVGLEPKIC